MEQIQQKSVRQRHSKVGRPSILTEEVVAKLDAALRNGMSDTTACEYANIDRATYYRHLNADMGFATKIADAKNFIKLLAGKRLVSILKDGSDKDAGPTARWFLERKEPQEYGRTRLIDNGPDFEIILPDWYLNVPLDRGNHENNQLAGTSQ